MIIDHISRLQAYEKMIPAVSEILAFMADQDLAAMPIGRYELGSSGAFILIQAYETKDWESARWEAHEKYIDIQLMLAGSEIMGGAPIQAFEVDTPYNPEKDIMFLKDNGSGHYLDIAEDNFAVFLPTDAHRPGCRKDIKADVKKAVIKIPVFKA